MQEKYLHKHFSFQLLKPNPALMSIRYVEKSNLQWISAFLTKKLQYLELLLKTGSSSSSFQKKSKRLWSRHDFVSACILKNSRNWKDMRRTSGDSSVQIFHLHSQTVTMKLPSYKEELGRYQKRLCMLIVLASVPNTFPALQPLVTQYSPEHALTETRLVQ